MPQKVAQVVGRGLPLLLDDIDTDRIIPARYLRCVTFDGLGEHAFEDDRKQAGGQHPFDDPRFQGAEILVAGRNFGCGSSREHAPQALIRWGIKAIIAESFAEIFFGNCISNGVPVVCCEPGHLRQLAALIESQPQARIEVDLERREVRASSGEQHLSCPLTIQEGARQSLVTGNWDFLGQLVDAADQVKAAASRLPYMSNFAQPG
ncbi:MAG: 3-isopropylmalate dehydratase small subunit [Planctomycetaceae bacterium]